MRTLVEFRGEAGELTLGETVTVEAFEVGARVKVAGVSKGKGFQGTIKRHNFSRGPEVARLAQRPRARLDRRLGDALARLQGHPRPGPDGQQARDPEGPRDRRRSTPRRTCCSCAARSPARAAGSWRCAAMPDAPILSAGAGAARKVEARRRRLRQPLLRAARAPERARRAGRPPPRHRRDENARRWSPAAAPSPGARRAPAAPAPAPAARRSGPAAAPSSAPSRAPTPSRSTARSSAPRCAARSRCTPGAARSRSSTPAAFEAPKTSQAFDLLDDWNQPRPDARRARRRGVRRRAVVPQPRARRGRSTADDVGVTDIVGAASLLVSEPALEALTARTGAPRAPRRGATA